MIERWLAREKLKSDPTLEGFWPLGSGLKDHSVYGNPPYHALSNNPLVRKTWPGRFVQHMGRHGYLMDTANRILTVGDGTQFDYSPTQPMTVSAWYWSPVLGATNVLPLVSKTKPYESDVTTNYGWSLQIQTSSFTGVGTDGIYFKWTINSYYGYSATIFAPFKTSIYPQAEWNHVCVTYNGNLSTSGMHVYHNGRQIPYMIVEEFLSGGLNPAPPHPLMIGAVWDTPRPVTGPTLANPNYCIDLVRVWSRELYPNQIADLYRREKVAYNCVEARYGLPPQQSHVDLYISGYDVLARDNLTLYISTIDYYHNQTTLFVSGEANNNSIPLIMFGANIQFDDTTLFIEGSPLFATTPLYISGLDTKSQFLPLYLAVAEPSVLTSGANLFVEGTINPGFSAQVTLYTSGVTPNTTRAMNLFLLGHPTDHTVRNMNLWIDGTNQVTPNWTTLFLKNTQEGITGDMTLFLQTTDGTPLASNMNLYLKRPFEEMLPLYLQGPGTELVAPTLTLVVHSGVTIENSVTLVMPSTIDDLDRKVTLYTHGW